MRWAEKLRLRMRSVFHRGDLERELDEELRLHFEQQVAENLAAGMSAEEARYAARRMIGGTEQIKEECRDRRGVNWIVSIAQDLRYAGRVYRKSPVFLATALTSLALGIGANSAIFTAADAFLWRPLPVKDPGSLVQLSVTRERPSDARSIPAPFIDELRKSSTVFSGVTDAVADGLSFSVGGPAERIVREAVAPNFFNFLGVPATLGRFFSAEVQRGQWAAETVLSHRYWKSRFAGDERVIGRTVRLNKFPFTIVGVAPDGFSGLDVGFEPELWVAMMPSGQELSQVHLLSESGGPIARLKPGVTLAGAEAATDAQFQHFLGELPPDRRGDPGHIHLLPGSTGDHGFVAEYEKPLAALMGMAGLVLLIACANVANILLARAAAREREFAVRASMWVGLPNGEMTGAILDEVSPGFFQTIGMRRLEGRDFSVADRDGSEPVVILNEVLARMLFGRENSLGRMVMARLRTTQPYRVVGVVRSSRYFDLHAAPPPAIYFAIQQATAYMPTLHVRVAQGRNTADVALAVRHEFDTLDKDVPVFNIKLLDDRVNDSLARERLVSVLAGTFGALAVLLAGVGLYGVMAYAVARRTREIGIRMALGSSPRAVLWIVGEEALALLGVGTAAGLAGGLIAARLASSQLFGLSATDPMTIFGATATMLLVTCLATLIPARRASRVDPMVALRYE